MRRYQFILLIVCFVISGKLSAQKDSLPDYKYKHMLSPAEENSKANFKTTQSFTDAPNGPTRCIAEFEPMAGVVIAYPFGVPIELVKLITEKDTLVTLVGNLSEENEVRKIYENANVDLSYCKFAHIDTDSYWTRDFSPIFMVDANKKLGAVDFVYNRPRPKDNKVPEQMASFLGIDYYSMNVVHTGGNYMCDGQGIAASTTIVYTESEDQGVSKATVDKNMKDYLGIHKYHVLKDPNNTYIDHIDCWGKFLDVDKILIRQVPTSHAQYKDLENMANYWKQQNSSWGNKYEVFRVFTPKDQPYTNSLILNGRVFVPITGSSNDEDALNVYKQAMPGYEVHGIVSSEWLSTDALHCRTHELADKNMLEIMHKPLLGVKKINSNVRLNSQINVLSGKGVYADSLFVFYKADGREWIKRKLEKIEGEDYEGIIPVSRSTKEIAYYIQAMDSAGRKETHPVMGKNDPHRFTVVRNKSYLTITPNVLEFDEEKPTTKEIIIKNSFLPDVEITDVKLAGYGAFGVSMKNSNQVYPIVLRSQEQMKLLVNPPVATKATEKMIDTLKVYTADSIYKPVLRSYKIYGAVESINTNWNERIYPNPVDKDLNVEIDFNEYIEVRKISLLNHSGAVIRNFKLDIETAISLRKKYRLDGNLASGMYFLLIETNKGNVTYKILKK